MDTKEKITCAKTVLEAGGNLIKTREDRELILVGKDGVVANEEDCNWIPNDKKVSKSVFRSRIEPWLTSLFQSEHLSLLCGSGITNAISYLSGSTGGTTMSGSPFTSYKTEIEEAAKEAAKASGREQGNIEDQIRTANDLLLGLKILKKDSEVKELQTNLNTVLTSFSKSILESERGIATSLDEQKRENAFSVLVNFLLSFASRTGNRERLNVFTTNYDRLIEVGAELAGIHLMDRFVGTMMPIFRSSRLNLDIHYNPPGIRGEPRYLEGVARLTKLHGSVDWVQSENEIRRIGLPFGANDIAPYLQAPGLKGIDALKLMIYPNSAKDRETAEYPYVELFRDFAAAICRPNSTLVTYGYGFGDEHINRVINDMLTIPSTHLVVISYNDPIGRILKFYYESAHFDQMSILMGKELGDITNLANDYLPKSAIDRTTIRMAELLQHRLGAASGTPSSTDASTSSVSVSGTPISTISK